MHSVLPKFLPGPILHFHFMKNCIHTSPLRSLIRSDDAGFILNHFFWTLMLCKYLVTFVPDRKLETFLPCFSEFSNCIKYMPIFFYPLCILSFSVEQNRANAKLNKA